MDCFAEGKSRFLLPGPTGHLEVLTQTPQEARQDISAVICHPHPLHQGTMDNKVVTTVANALLQHHCRVLRFNFRGVGQSEGEYGHITGECDDLRAVLTWLSQVRPYDAVILAGFSFGAYISANVAVEYKPAGLISIAPAVHHGSFEALLAMPCPWLVVQGDQDEVVSCAQVQKVLGARDDVTQLVVMPGAGHFFHHRLIDLREQLSTAMLACGMVLV
jgi:alpha/beta superfamily hydrolase